MGSAFGDFWEDPEGGFIKFTVKRASKLTRPNTQYGGETSRYSLLQDGVWLDRRLSPKDTKDMGGVHMHMQSCMPFKIWVCLPRAWKSDARLFTTTYIERVVPYLPWWICSLPLISPTSNLLESFSMFNTSALMFCKALDDATKIYLQNLCELWSSSYKGSGLCRPPYTSFQ